MVGFSMFSVVLSELLVALRVLISGFVPFVFGRSCGPSSVIRLSAGAVVIISSVCVR